MQMGILLWPQWDGGGFQCRGWGRGKVLSSQAAERRSEGVGRMPLAPPPWLLVLTFRMWVARALVAEQLGQDSESPRLRGHPWGAGLGGSRGEMGTHEFPPHLHLLGGGAGWLRWVCLPLQLSNLSQAQARGLLLWPPRVSGTHPRAASSADGPRIPCAEVSRGRQRALGL